jgi:hypothetical protein
MRKMAVVVCLMACFSADAEATMPMNHCTSIVSVNGRAVAGIVVGADMSPHLLALFCGNVTLATPGKWKGYSGRYLPAGWKIGDVYRNSAGEVVEVVAPPRLLPAVNASLVPVFSSQDGWQRVR